MSPPATPWSNQPKGLPSKESSGGAELAIDPVILTAITIPSTRRKYYPDLGMLIGTSFAVLLSLVAYLFVASIGSAPDSAPAARSAGTDTTAAPANAAQVSRGLTIGKVTANDGKTLAVQGILGATTNVRVSTDTRVLVLTGNRVSDVTVGAAVVVYGNKEADGTITANLIVGGSVS
ncbi:hypothetical protein [Nocardia pseudovaccinii]|uniref:hypothetical protein n=1 Tax=Nocardia pseudovaccinii TaxID=189540 RepID=UPI0007A4B1C3|nr:hypothetical protein [Nocardia pseudovaccinii]